MLLIRATVSDLLGRPDARCESLVLLGAGNCLDIDPHELNARFKNICLVDADAVAVTEASSRFLCPADAAKSSACSVHAPTDIAHPLLTLTADDFRPEEDRREHCISILQQLASPVIAEDLPTADVVVSLCVFSQLVLSLRDIIDERHPTFTNALKALRIGHLRRMLHLLRPGGVGILISDIVSSDSAPELTSTTPDELPSLVNRLVNSGNFFSGTNPALVLNDLNVLTKLPGGPETVHTIDPWLWNLGPRTYAVYGMRYQKAGANPES